MTQTETLGVDEFTNHKTIQKHYERFLENPVQVGIVRILYASVFQIAKIFCSVLFLFNDQMMTVITAHNRKCLQSVTSFPGCFVSHTLIHTFCLSYPLPDPVLSCLVPSPSRPDPSKERHKRLVVEINWCILRVQDI